MYASMIAGLLLALRTGCKPTKRLLETLQFYLLGWVSDAEFDRRLEASRSAAKKTRE